MGLRGVRSPSSETELTSDRVSDPSAPCFQCKSEGNFLDRRQAKGKEMKGRKEEGERMSRFGGKPDAENGVLENEY